MKNNIWIVSLLVGLVVVLVVGGVSLLVRVNYVSKEYQEVIDKNMELEQNIQILKAEKAELAEKISSLAEENSGLKETIQTLRQEKSQLSVDLKEIEAEAKAEAEVAKPKEPEEKPEAADPGLTQE